MPETSCAAVDLAFSGVPNYMERNNVKNIKLSLAWQLRIISQKMR